MSIYANPAIENAVRCPAGTAEACSIESLCQGVCASRLSDRPSDEAILQHLGASVMLCWAQLPLGARDRILRQADDVIGFAPIPQVRNEIVKLLLRHAKARWVASLLSVRSVRSALASRTGPSA
jgi:hypothetical protein